MGKWLRIKAEEYEMNEKDMWDMAMYSEGKWADEDYCYDSYDEVNIIKEKYYE